MIWFKIGGFLVNSYRFIDLNNSDNSTIKPNVFYLFNNTKLITQRDIENLATYDFYEKLFSYVLAVWLIFYSMGQFIFYLLGRGDVTYFTGHFCLGSSLCYYIKFRIIRGQFI